MKILKTILIQVFLLFLLTVRAQHPEQFDIVTYQVPAGWTKDAGNGFVAYTVVNPSNGEYARISIYKSLSGTGKIDDDFETEWKELVQVNYQPGQFINTGVSDYKDGWISKIGVAAFQYQNKNNAAVLVTQVKDKTKMSFVFISNTTTYQSLFEDFGSSLAFGNSQSGSNQEKQEQQKTSSNANPPATQVNQQNFSTSGRNTAFTFTTSNFDDGWTSTIQNDWVLVEKNNAQVYLFYAVPYNSDNFSGTGVMDRDYYWDNYVAKQFQITTKQYKDDGEFISSLKPKYVEGRGTDLQTGETRFIAMTLSVSPNSAQITVSSYPDEDKFRQAFPNANGKFSSDLTEMSRYNKFAIGSNDLEGTWQNGNTSTAQWYYISPAGYEGYAGMTLAASSATFHFQNNGNYTSIHNGATGAVGSMNSFQQEYKGNYSVTNWKITATNRYGGKTDQFDAYFIAVRGGRLLKMNNQAGQDYSLVKVSIKNEPTVSNTTTQQNSNLNTTDSKLFSKWNRLGAIHPYYADADSWGTAGYTSSRYEFNANGTYLFTERSFRMTYQYILIVKENGTYTINGNQLTIVPQNSTIQSYNKKNNVDELGTLVKTQNRPLEKVTYNYQFHYFSGIQEWNLVLQADKPTLRDGNFSSNNTFSNAWYFDQKYIDKDLTSPKGK